MIISVIHRDLTMIVMSVMHSSIASKFIPQPSISEAVLEITHALYEYVEEGRRVIGHMVAEAAAEKTSNDVKREENNLQDRIKTNH